MVLIDNPIILKECLQASHRKRTYVLRAAMPLLTVIVALPLVISVMDRWGQDWRAISQIARSIFMPCAWLELIAFSLLAFAYCAATVHDEWTHKTMEVLCASPLSRMQILYGKFVAALTKILLAALSLLPVMGIWFHMGRLPRAIVLGSFAVILGSVLFFGSMALFQAAMFRPLKGGAIGLIGLILPYFLALVLLDAFVWVRHPLLEAAIPPRTLYLVLAGRAPTGWSTGTFALLSLGMMSGMSLLLLGVSPWLFARTFGRHIGGGGTRGGKLRRMTRLFAGSRPPMRWAQNPFYWQELGPPTRALRWSVWVVYGVTAIFVLALGLKIPGGFDFLDEEEFWVFVAFEGLIALVLMALLYGTVVFARERLRRRSQALLLSGRRPLSFFCAKIHAAYRSLRFPMLAVGVACVVMFIMLGARFWRRDPESALVLLCVLQLLLFGPAFGVILGMVFSVTARSPMRAALGLFMSVVWAIGLAWLWLGIMDGALDLHWADEPEPCMVAALIATGVLLLITRTWRPWRLGLLLALNFWVFITILASVDNAFHGDMEGIMMTVLGSAGLWVVMILWFLMGLRLFDRGMAGEPARLWRRR